MSAVAIPIRDISEQEHKDAELLAKFEVFRDFTRIFLDGFVLINSQRKILKFNQGLCAAFGVKAIDVKKLNTIDDLINMPNPSGVGSAVDEIMKAAGPLRIDEIQATRNNGENCYQLIVGSYPFFDSKGEFIGACIILRDVTAETNLQGKYKEKSIQSVTDPLTGLYLRRYFEEQVDSAMMKLKEMNQPPAIGILMFDLDKFKSINDTFGHQAGDFVLVETAKILNSVSRKTDIVGRYGGEEILIVVFGATREGCCQAAEKFRIAVEEHEFIFEGKRVPVSTSVGVSLFTDLNDSRENVVARADKCLYAAKANGRNAVYCDFGEKPDPERVTPEGQGGRPDLGAAGFGH
ncbi:MAG: diguanylate cyclase [Silvanigrellaceae bacterium]